MEQQNLKSYRLSVRMKVRLTIFSIQALTLEDAFNKANRILKNFAPGEGASFELHTPDDRILAIASQAA